MALTEEKIVDETQAAKNREIQSQIPSKEDITVNTSEDEKNGVFDGEISLDAIRKKRFRIDGDNKRILELNTSDLSTITRLEQLYPKLQQLSQDAAVKQLEESNDLETTAHALTKIDAQMRQILDEIFDSNVSEVCAPYGSMFDPFNGEFRFEHIIEVISKLYESNIASEIKKMSARMKKHTAKYTKGR